MVKIFIGVAWPYANGKIHFGHIAGSNLAPDIFARFHRACGNEVLMVSGSDMHGTPTTVTAEKEGIPPDEVARRYHEINSKALKMFGISHDLYTHTATEHHASVVHEMFKRFMEEGYLYEAETVQAYCPRCMRFLPDRYIEGICPYCNADGARGDQCTDSCGRTLDPSELRSPRCKICSTPPEFRPTKHLFFRLSAFQPRLSEWSQGKTHWRTHVRAFTEKWLTDGLKDRAVTRDIDYGITVPVPGYESKRIYVWFEAVIGYLSASKLWAEVTGNPEKWKEFWYDPEVRHYYFLGKDNIPFHTIIWPAMLMAYDSRLNLPYDVPANEFLQVKGEKISKSRATSDMLWAVSDYLEMYPPDPMRYYLTIHMPENHDTEFLWEEFIERNNSDLCDTLGNLIHRVAKFSYEKFRCIPDHSGVFTREDHDLIDRIRKTHAEVTSDLEACRFKGAIEKVMALAHEGNRYFFQMQPWKLYTEDQRRCKDVLHLCFRLVKSLGVMLWPFIPFTAEKILEMVHEPLPVRWGAAVEDVPPVELKHEPLPLFKKIEKTRKVRLPDLRIARITKVELHPSAERLYILTVSLGQGSRRIVSGIREWYTPEDLLNRNIVLVTNLKPATIRGVESNGMLLAAEGSKHPCSLIVPGSEAKEGDHVSGYECEEQIDIKEFRQFDLRIGVSSGDGVVDTGRGSVRISQKLSGEFVVDLTDRDNPKVPMCNGKPLIPLKEAGPGAKVL